MFVSRSPHARWLVATGLSAALACALVGCDAVADGSPTPRHGASAAPPAGFDPDMRRKVVLTAKPSAPAAEVEAFYADHLKPALSRDPRIGDLAVFVDTKTGAYVVELELRTPDAPAYSLALDVLGVGSTPEQAAQTLATFAAYFDTGATQVLTRRRDLSLDRAVLGTIKGSK